MKTTHLDYETLADLAEGLLDDEQAASANDHLTGCAQCRDRSAELDDVSRLLADTPLPALPAALAERIGNAIAAEASGPAATSGWFSRRGHARLLSVAAAALVAVGGGVLVGREVLRSSATPDFSKSQAAQDPAVAGGRAARESAPQGIGPSGRNAAPDGYRLVASGTDYRSATLGEQVGTVLRSPDRGDTGVVLAIGMEGCVSRVASNGRPALVDLARYNGRSATLIATRSAEPNMLDVWVVGNKCSATDSDVIAHTRTTTG